MNLIYLEESVGTMQLLGTWVTGFTKLESLRFVEMEWTGWEDGFCQTSLAYEICIRKIVD